MLVLPLFLLLLGAQFPTTELVSVDSNGNQGLLGSFWPALSLNGRIVAFSSNADNLVAGDTNSVRDVFVHDRQTGITTLVSRGVAGEFGNDDSTTPSISGNGKFVAFSSRASNLVPGDTNARNDIFVCELQTGNIIRANISSLGIEANDSGFLPAISHDGSVVAFYSFASNLVSNDTNSSSDIFLHDLLQHTTFRISIGWDGNQANSDSYWPTISSDGNRISFISTATNIVDGDNNQYQDIFLYDRRISSSILVSTDTQGSQGNFGSFDPSISGDGQHVVFWSYANNLVPNDINNYPDVFVRDIEAGMTSRISVTSSGDEALGTSGNSVQSISFFGELVVFESSATNLVPGDTNGTRDVFLHSRSTEETTLISINNAGSGTGNGTTYYGVICGNGSASGFVSVATDLTPSDGNSVDDVFIRSPLFLDSDVDAITDQDEVRIGTNPLDQDSDDDGLSDGEEFYSMKSDTRWLQGSSGNWYRLALPNTWNESSLSARLQGLELATIRDQSEADWLHSTYAEIASGFGGGYWIGLNDFGGFLNWTSGEAVGYLNWAAGEPSTSPFAAFVGGPNATEPGKWYADFAGVSQLPAIIEATASGPPSTTTDPRTFDSDGDGLGDGQEQGVDQLIWDGDLDGDGIPDVAGTDMGVFLPDLDPLSTTDPLDMDSDDDGLTDGDEDLDSDGAVGSLETDPGLADTDSDLLQDGQELGLVSGTPDTNGNVFAPDADPGTTTNPIAADSDSGGVPDGVEDQNQDGGLDSWETDPNAIADDDFAFYIYNFHPGEKLWILVYNAEPLVNVIPAYSLSGPGPTALGIGLTLDLTMPIHQIPAVLTNSFGFVDQEAFGSSGRLPANAPPGFLVYWQAVEVPLKPGSALRVSNSLVLPVGSN